MILIGQYDSSFVRRVALALRIYGLPFEHRPWSVFGDGERIRELRGVTDAVLTEDGIATAVISRNDLACTGIEVDHPDFKERLECNADDLRWSPDGRYLALIPQAESAPVQVLDVTTGDLVDVPHAGPEGTVPTWSEDSRYLIWIWGAQV